MFSHYRGKLHRQQRRCNYDRDRDWRHRREEGRHRRDHDDGDDSSPRYRRDNDSYGSSSTYSEDDDGDKSSPRMEYSDRRSSQVCDLRRKIDVKENDWEDLIRYVFSILIIFSREATLGLALSVRSSGRNTSLKAF